MKPHPGNGETSWPTSPLSAPAAVRPGPRVPEGRHDVDLFQAGAPWAPQARPALDEAVRQRLARLADWLQDRDYLEQRFTAADLLMTTVLQILRETDLVTSVPVLDEA